MIGSRNAPDETTHTHDVPSDGTGDSFTVMCIDDNVSLIDALESRLALEPGFAGMLRAEPLRDAVAQAASHAPTIVLLDYDLPNGLDALQLLQRLTSESPTSRVILFTGYPDRQLLADSMSLGAWGFVSKGTETDRLISAIHRVRNGEAVVELDA